MSMCGRCLVFGDWTMKAFSTDADNALRVLSACHTAGFLFFGLREMIQFLGRGGQILRGLRIGRSDGVVQGFRSFFGIGHTEHGLGEARVPRNGLLTTVWCDGSAERRCLATSGDRILASEAEPTARIRPRDNGRGSCVNRGKSILRKGLGKIPVKGITGSIHAGELMGSGVQG